MSPTELFEKVVHQDAINIANILIPKIFHVLKRRWDAKNQGFLEPRVLYWTEINSCLGSCFSINKKEAKMAVRATARFFPCIKINCHGIKIMEVKK